MYGKPTREMRREQELQSRVEFRSEYRAKIANGRFKVRCMECGGRLTKIPDSEWEVFTTAIPGVRIRHIHCSKDAT